MCDLLSPWTEFVGVYLEECGPCAGLFILRVLRTNSLFMSLPVAMDGISKTRAARRNQRKDQILELQLTCCESGAPTVIAQIASTFFDKTLKC